MKSKILALFLSLFICSTAWAEVNFDSVDDSLETDTAVTMPQTVSISVWVNFNSAGEGGFARILVFDNGGAASTTGLGISAGIDIGFRADWTTDYTGTLDSNLSTGAWHHIVATYDGSLTTNEAIVYVDGTATTLATIDPTGTLTTSFGEIIIGNVGDGTRTFDGKISEAAIWNVILTQQEVNELYNSKVKRMPLQIRPSSLIRFWPLDDRADGLSADGTNYSDYSSTRQSVIGKDGANNTGLTAKAEEVLSYA